MYYIAAIATDCTQQKVIADGKSTLESALRMSLLEISPMCAIDSTSSEKISTKQRLLRSFPIIIFFMRHAKLCF